VGAVLSFGLSAWLLGRQNRSQRYHEQWMRVLNAYQDFSHYIQILTMLQATRDDPKAWPIVEKALKSLNDVTLLDPWGQARVHEMDRLLDLVTAGANEPLVDASNVRARLVDLFRGFQSDVASHRWNEEVTSVTSA
jgi:hypothetical protein